MPKFFSSWERVELGAVTKIRSPCRSTKLPSGATASPARTTAHTSTRHLVTLLKLESATSFKGLSLPILSSTSSVRPLAKVSRRKKPGYFKSRSISKAACRSGLTVKDRGNTWGIVSTCWAYSGVRIRAMVWSLSFIPWAVIQHSRFSSSSPVAAISKSAS